MRLRKAHEYSYHNPNSPIRQRMYNDAVFHASPPQIPPEDLCRPGSCDGQGAT